MPIGECLCAAISWEISEKPDHAYHCHCSMCRKMHAAAFATYVISRTEHFKWKSNLSTLKNVQSSEHTTRNFCGRCGSVVPSASHNQQQMFVPAGSMQMQIDNLAHIFVAHKAPWFDINDNLPQHANGPPEIKMQSITRTDNNCSVKGVLNGRCLCGTVKYKVTEPFLKIHNCHCSRCRRARSAAFTTNGFTKLPDVTFTQGKNDLTTYKDLSAQYFTHVFCNHCGSGMPRKDAQRRICIVPLGTLEDAPQRPTDDHIFTADKADWYSITDDLPSFAGAP